MQKLLNEAEEKFRQLNGSKLEQEREVEQLQAKKQLIQNDGNQCKNIGSPFWHTVWHHRHIMWLEGKEA